MLLKYKNFNQTYILKKNQVLFLQRCFFGTTRTMYQRKSLAVVVLESDDVLV